MTNEKLTFKKFEEINGRGTPILRHPEYGILIASIDEYAHEKELCLDCERNLEKYGAYDQDCGCQQDHRFIGLWSPIDWAHEQPAEYFVNSVDTPKEMYNDFECVEIDELEFTGKFKA